MNIHRPRRSTLVAAAIFVATAVLYLLVRPPPEPSRPESPTPVSVVPSTDVATTDSGPPATEVEPSIVAPESTDAPPPTGPAETTTEDALPAPETEPTSDPPRSDTASRSEAGFATRQDR